MACYNRYGQTTDISYPVGAPQPQPLSSFSLTADQLRDLQVGDTTTGYSVGGPGQFLLAGLIGVANSLVPPTVALLEQATVFMGVLNSVMNFWGSDDGVVWTIISAGAPGAHAFYQVGIQGDFTVIVPNVNGYTPFYAQITDDVPSTPSDRIIITGRTATFWSIVFDTGTPINSYDAGGTQGWSVSPLPAIEPNGVYQQVPVVPPQNVTIVRGVVPAGASTFHVDIYIPAPLDDGQRFTYNYWLWTKPYYLATVQLAELTDFRALDSLNVPIPLCGPPAPPVTAPVWSGVCEGGQLTITWAASLGATSYDVELNGVIVGGTLAPLTTFTLNGLTPGVSYVVGVRANNVTTSSVFTVKTFKPCTIVTPGSTAWSVQPTCTGTAWTTAPRC